MTAQLPRWTLEQYFISLESDSFAESIAQTDHEIAKLKLHCRRVPIEAGDPLDTTDYHAAALQEALDLFNSAAKRFQLLNAYVMSFLSTDVDNELAQSKRSELEPLQTELAKLESRLTAWLGRLDLDAVYRTLPPLRDHSFPLSRMKKAAAKQMSEGEEDLAAELDRSGGSAWARLYGNVSSTIQVPWEGETKPMSAIRALAYDRDPEVRRSAYEAELETWKQHERPLAMAMNSIKGQWITLTKRRGWTDVLEPTLFVSNMDREPLEAMMSAARDAFPAFRRYLEAKAKLLGHSGALPWHDLFAPVGKERTWEWDQACAYVEDRFKSYSTPLARLAKKHFEDGWIDAEPRTGKRDGAFCMGTIDGESRVMMNFKPAFGSVATLAHELGHSYHNMCLRERQPLQKRTPMTLAETASIFCEQIVKKSALQQAEGEDRLAILEASIMGCCQTVVDITSRYLFESEVFARRATREMPAREFCEIMEQAQRDTYGDGLSTYHPYMWAAKPHYYSPARSFYNFPYMFGLLFAMGLYAQYEKEPFDFPEKMDSLLASTGMDDAASLVARFGLDIREKDFWASSLAIIEKDIEEFCKQAEGGE